MTLRLSVVDPLVDSLVTLVMALSANAAPR